MFRIKLNIEIQEISVALLPNSSHGLSTRLEIFTSVFIFFLTCYGYGIECRFYCVQNKIIGTPAFFHPSIINFLAFRENSHFGKPRKSAWKRVLFIMWRVDRRKRKMIKKWWLSRKLPQARIFMKPPETGNKLLPKISFCLYLVYVEALCDDAINES